MKKMKTTTIMRTTAPKNVNSLVHLTVSPRWTLHRRWSPTVSYVIHPASTQIYLSEELSALSHTSCRDDSHCYSSCWNQLQTIWLFSYQQGDLSRSSWNLNGRRKKYELNRKRPRHRRSAFPLRPTLLVWYMIDKIPTISYIGKDGRLQEGIMPDLLAFFPWTKMESPSTSPEAVMERDDKHLPPASLQRARMSCFPSRYPAGPPSRSGVQADKTTPRWNRARMSRFEPNARARLPSDLPARGSLEERRRESSRLKKQERHSLPPLSLLPCFCNARPPTNYIYSTDKIPYSGQAFFIVQINYDVGIHFGARSVQCQWGTCRELGHSSCEKPSSWKRGGRREKGGRRTEDLISI